MFVDNENNIKNIRSHYLPIFCLKSTKLCTRTSFHKDFSNSIESVSTWSQNQLIGSALFRFLNPHSRQELIQVQKGKNSDAGRECD